MILYFLYLSIFDSLLFFFCVLLLLFFFPCLLLSFISSHYFLSHFTFYYFLSIYLFTYLFAFYLSSLSVLLLPVIVFCFTTALVRCAVMCFLLAFAQMQADISMDPKIRDCSEIAQDQPKDLL